MKRKLFYEALLILIIGVTFCRTVKAANDVNDFVGEKITYSIKQLGLTAGEATLTFEGPSSREDKDYLLITFKAQGMNFLDAEKIYADPQTLLPQVVERDLNIFGKKEKITESYESLNGKVRIVKTAAGKITEQVIAKKGSLDNIYCFIYRYRRDAEFKTNDTLAINLPTMDLKIRLQEKMELAAAGKKYQAFFMQSTPSKYKLWFDVSRQKIPLRIDGAVGIGNTTMTMKSYETKSTFARLAQ